MAIELRDPTCLQIGTRLAATRIGPCLLEFCLLERIQALRGQRPQLGRQLIQTCLFRLLGESAKLLGLLTCAVAHGLLHLAESLEKAMQHVVLAQRMQCAKETVADASCLVSNIVKRPGNAVRGDDLPGSQYDGKDHAEGEEAVLSVHNEGTPIAPDTMERLFDPFVRGETGIVSSPRTGLGLLFAGYALQYAADRHATVQDALPLWYERLRLKLSQVVLLSLAIAWALA